MQWWAWVAVGAILLGAELTFVDAQFYLVFLGAAALIVGFMDLSGWISAVWLQWICFAALAAASMFTFRQRIYDHLRRDLPVMKHGPAGETLVVPESLAPGQSCRVEFRGSTWSALNGGAAPIAAGEAALIDRVDGVTLIVMATLERG